MKFTASILIALCALSAHCADVVLGDLRSGTTLGGSGADRVFVFGGSVVPTTLDLTIVTATNGSFWTVNSVGATNLWISWGDTVVSNVTKTTTAASKHYYTTAGTYVVSISGIVSWLYFDQGAVQRAYLKNSGTIPLPTLNNGIGMYYPQTDLTNISVGALQSLTNLVTIGGPAAGDGMFESSGITSQQPGMFDALVRCTNFGRVFLGCAITSIPDNAYAYNTNAVSFYMTYRNSSISSIGTNVFVTDNPVTFLGTLVNCTALTSYPPGLFNRCPGAITFGGASATYGCFEGSPIVNLQPATFSSNLFVQTYERCFAECSQLTNLPSDLVPDNTALVNVRKMFYNDIRMKGSAIPFWDTNRWPNIVHGAGSTQCFYNCTNLANWADIPTDFK